MHTLEFRELEYNNFDHIADSISLCKNLKKFTIKNIHNYSAESLNTSESLLKDLEMLTVSDKREGIVIQIAFFNILDAIYLN